jgi:uncharacterized membrane protein YeaQ/YmgE (transglycosylase-associated protein family)
MHHVLSALMGAALGLLAARMTSAQAWTVLADAVMGALGALAGAWFLAPLSLDPATSRFLSQSEEVGAVLGGVFALAVWVLLRPPRK